MQQEKKPYQLEEGRFYRCLPTLFEANIICEYVVDLDSTCIQFFKLSDFSLYKRIEILEKEDHYCAQMSVVSQNVLVIFGVEKLIIFNVQEMSIVETIKINYYIQKIQTKNGYIVIMTSQEDSELKIIHCWKLSPSGQIVEKYKATPFKLCEFQDCTEDNISIALIISIQNLPKVYVYWSHTNVIIEIDPIQQLYNQYNKQNSISFITDLSAESYAEISDGKINVMNKKTGKRIAQLFNENQMFRCIYGEGTNQNIYTISNLGVKKWKLEANVEPELFTSSQKYEVGQLFFTKGKIVGLNRQLNNVIKWDSPQICHAHSFPNEVIRKVLAIDHERIFFLLEATASQKQENQFYVSKYNKLQIFDFQKDIQIAKKAMLQAKYSVDGESIIIKKEEEIITIRFIVNQQAEAGDKKYILKWTPFHKDENNKDTKRKQIKNAKDFNSFKMYNFNRIIAFSQSKQGQSFSVFSNNAENKTVLALFDFNAKKIGDYDFAADVQNVELSEQKKLYTVGCKSVCIYSINENNKNRLEKINQLNIKAVYVKPFQCFLLVRKTDSFLLLDSDFECVMREDADENCYESRMIKLGQKFLLKTEKCLTLWDTQQQTTREVNNIECDPNVIEYVQQKLVVADKWVQVYDLNFS